VTALMAEPTGHDARDAVGERHSELFDAAVVAAVRRVPDPCSIATGVPVDLIDMGLVLEASRTDGLATIRLQLTSPMCIQIGMIEAKIRTEVSALAGVRDVVVEIDHQAEWLPTKMASHVRRALRERRPFAAVER
jgi:metal-sulfur cluster biosynthetic enzyme